jgi:betaine lipid synthase
LNGVSKVVSVDINPAQTALLELKVIVIKQLDYQDFWKLFGEGYHENFNTIYRNRLSPLLSTCSRQFWDKKKKYFKDGLYYHGSMGKVALLVQHLCKLLGIEHLLKKLVHAETLKQQEKVWKRIVGIMTSKRYLVNLIVEKIFGIVFLNKVVVWFGGGVPQKQLQLIKEDGVSLTHYFYRCINKVLTYSHLAKDNYFYLNILTGCYSKDCCPSYLKEDNFHKLKNGLLDNLVISTDYFMNELCKRKYDKVILMDHADWQDENSTMQLAKSLYEQMNVGGKIILRSAGLKPLYVEQLENIGFDVVCHGRIDESNLMDRVCKFLCLHKKN